jgi:hypothetical protein
MWRLTRPVSRIRELLGRRAGQPFLLDDRRAQLRGERSGQLDGIAGDRRQPGLLHIGVTAGSFSDVSARRRRIRQLSGPTRES